MSNEKDMEFRDAREQLASSIGEAAAGRELGELFEYRIGTPVTLAVGSLGDDFTLACNPGLPSLPT